MAVIYVRTSSFCPKNFALTVSPYLVYLETSVLPL